MKSKSTLSLGVLVGAALLLRTASLVSPGLTDPSESRFVAAALEMLRTGDWVTPKIFDSAQGFIPYLAKPPFHMWAIALSLHQFGVSEWAARLPGLLAVVLAALSVIAFGRRFYSTSVGLVAAILLLAAPGLFLGAASAITDGTLTGIIAGALCSFALCVSSDHRGARWGWGLLMFALLGIGMLTKGPVSGVLVGVTVLLWLIVQWDVRPLLRLPWFTGLALWAAIWLPWYLAAERANPPSGDFPGFLFYYFVEENIYRYVKSDWNVRFGSLHHHPHGTIWVFFLGAIFPWSLLLLFLRRSHLRISAGIQALRSDPWLCFAVAWMLSPLLFFTLARQIIMTYAFPAIPGAALVGAILLSKKSLPFSATTIKALLIICASSSLVIITIGLFYGCASLALIASLAGTLILISLISGRDNETQRSATYQTAALAYACCVLLTSVVTGFDQPISNNRSTRGVFAELDQLTQHKSPLEICMILKFAHSSHFYALKHQRMTVASCLSPESFLKAGATYDYGIILRRNLAALSSQEREALKVVLYSGDYAIVQRTTQPS